MEIIYFLFKANQFYLFNIKIYTFFDVGIGDLGLGIGPNPQSPINCQ